MHAVPKSQLRTTRPRKMLISASRRSATVSRPYALTATALALALSACTALVPAPANTPSLPVPSVWSGLAAAETMTSVPTPLARWWLRFDDPLLVALIDEALRANQSVRSAVAALVQSRALRDVQAAALVPGVTGSASAQRNRVDAGSANAFRAGFDASWEPDIFGGTRAAVAAADADTHASAATLGDVQVSVAAEVAVNYMQWRGLQERLVIARANLDSQQETLQITQWRAQAGLVTVLEVEQARAAAEQTRALIPALQTTAAQTEHALAALTRNAPDGLHARLNPPAAAPVVNDSLVLDIPAETLRQRPDIRAAEARVVAASARVTQADAARYPSFKLDGSIGLAALTLGSLANGSSVVSALFASVAGPIFDGGAGAAQVRAQQAALEQARAGYDTAVLTALRDVEDSLVALRNDRERLVSLRAAAAAAGNAALLARQRFDSGLIDFQVVLDTQRTALISQQNVAVTAADLNADHVRLYKALGGGWEPSDPLADATLRTPPSRP